MTKAIFLGAALAVALASSATAADVARTYASPTAPIAQTVSVPASDETVYVSGVIADLPKPPAPTPDTEAQAENIFGKIAGVLHGMGLGEQDVVSMTIYMAAPPDQPRMDFAGMMKAYGRHYGTAAQPNRPARATVQVSALALPGALLEVSVIAVRAPKP